MAKAFKQVWKSITGVPAADLATKRYTFVKYDANGKIVSAGAGQRVIGVLEEPNDVDQPAQVVAQGFMYVKLGADLSAGAEVMSDANGAAIAYDSSVATNRYVGVLAVGGASGDIGTVLLG